MPSENYVSKTWFRYPCSMFVTAKLNPAEDNNNHEKFITTGKSKKEKVFAVTNIRTLINVFTSFPC